MLPFYLFGLLAKGGWYGRFLVLIEIEVYDHVIGFGANLAIGIEDAVMYAETGILNEGDTSLDRYIAGIVERLNELAGRGEQYRAEPGFGKFIGEAGGFPVVDTGSLYEFEIGHIIDMAKEVHLAPVEPQGQLYGEVGHSGSVISAGT